MKHVSRIVATLALAAPVILGPALYGRTSAQSDPQADNTKANKPDQDQGKATADQQKMNATDRDITKKIRSALHNDASLSAYAHNIKIISIDGKVTLKGPVRSDEEKNKVAMEATTIAGEGNVTNEITVAPPKS
jgi:hyperosmotically inducible periplasmic protein